MVNYYQYSLKNLRRRGIRSWLTLLGILIGITAVVALITLGNGLKTAVNSQFGVSSTQAITIQAGGLNLGSPGSAVANPLTKQDAEAIGKLSTIEFATTRNIEQLIIEYNNKIKVNYIIGIEEGTEKESYELIGIASENGRLLQSGDSKKIVIGHNFIDRKKNGFEKDIKIGKSLMINNQSFIIIGILEKKGSFIMDNIIIMPEKDLDNLVHFGDNVDIIGVKVKDKDLMDKAKEDIEKLLRKRRNVKVGKEDFQVSTPDAILSQVNSVIGGIQIFIVLIASISILVGAIGIVNTMATSVIERRKEIGIMKAIGARNKHIFLLFLVESGFMGFIGGLLGVIFGLFIGYFGTVGINNFVGITAKPTINYFLIFFVLIGSFLLGALAGILPAMGAAKENPVEVLRWEYLWRF